LDEIWIGDASRSFGPHQPIDYKGVTFKDTQCCCCWITFTSC